MAPVDPPDELTRRELRSLLERELYLLPEKYRAPLVLCYLEGKTHQEAARQLGWPPGSMSVRLARGRELLRERLEQHRHGLPAGACFTLLSRDFAAAEVPAGLVEATVRAGLELPLQGQAPKPPAGRGAALLVALLLLAGALLGAGGGLFAHALRKPVAARPEMVAPDSAEPGAGGCSSQRSCPRP